MRINLYKIDKEKVLSEMFKHMEDSEVELFNMLIDKEKMVNNLIRITTISLLETNESFEHAFKKFNNKLTRNKLELQYDIEFNEGVVYAFISNYTDSYSTELALNGLFGGTITMAKEQIASKMQSGELIFETFIVSYILETLDEYKKNIKKVELDSKEYLEFFIAIFSGGLMYNHLIVKEAK